MKRRSLQIAILFLLAVLMFLASGLRGSYFCVSPWAGDAPHTDVYADAHP
jgi:hypothetical protein